MSIAVEICTAQRAGQPVVVFNLGECAMLLSPEDAGDVGRALMQASDVVTHKPSHQPESKHA